MLSKTAGTYFVAFTLPLIPCLSAADVMWTYNTDIDKTPHFLRINRISETSPPAEEVQGVEIDGRYAMSDRLGIVARYSFGSGDAVEDGQTSDSKLKIVDIGITYGLPLNDQLFYELKAVYNYRQSSFSENEGATEKESQRSIRLTPRVRYDINSYLQARALIEFEKPEHEDLGSEAAIYLTLTPINKLALDFKFGKGLTTTNHNDPDEGGKWSNDAWYVEPRVSYRINSTVSIEAGYRDKKEGGRLVDFGAVVFF
ncbi:porin family protein [Endozoicomonas sp. SCSIO W0465]|uniref:porin family protein n=1 Tax=Endozoicomonas sp. SCSIO W0465 TaxID=2918516 RepID=UPI00207559FD|nr:porin family protein [Endozoicomonas sp. SCSIO W0465]USE39456.1 porin family protein [Endozoicomonas sp. SCSIO W0465]